MIQDKWQRILKISLKLLSSVVLIIVTASQLHSQLFTKSESYLLLYNPVNKSTEAIHAGTKAKIIYKDNRLILGRVKILNDHQLKVNETLIDPTTIRQLSLPPKIKAGIFIGAGLATLGSILLIRQANSNEEASLGDGYVNIFGGTMVGTGIILTFTTANKMKKKHYDLSKAWELKVHY